MSTTLYRERSIIAASRWIRLSCRARQLKLSAAPTTISPNKQQARHIAQRPKDFTRFSQCREFSSTPGFAAAPTRQPKLPYKPARTRFAPSPTGYLHIGGLRTALFSFLLARRTGGQFLLRIEDTDQKRLVADAEERLCDDLNWAGLQWDEGPGVESPYGPYRQSERTHIYQEHAQRLIREGSAYGCFCTPQASGAQAAYVTSGCYQNCSSLSLSESYERAERGEAFTVRLRQPDRSQKRVYPDLVYGNIQPLKRSPAAPQIASEDDTGIDAADTILMKSDGVPTYHFANVVDDHLMKITHVIRGVEWMASTPLHYDIYSAFGWDPPQFAHVPLLVDQNKAKLSKRNQDLALDVASMRDQHGVLPYTLNNFLALLGWSNPTGNDVMDMDALVANFDLKFTRGNTMVRMEKLWFLQKQHVASRCERARKTRSLPPIVDIISKITAEVRRRYPKQAADFDRRPKDGSSHSVDSSDALTKYCTAILLTDSKTFENASQFADRHRHFFSRPEYGLRTEQEAFNEAGTITPEMLRYSILCALEQYTASNGDQIQVEYLHGRSESQHGSDFTETNQGITQRDAFATLARAGIYSVLLSQQALIAAFRSQPRFDFPFFDPPEARISFPAEAIPDPLARRSQQPPPPELEDLATLVYTEKAFAKINLRDGSDLAKRILEAFKKLKPAETRDGTGQIADEELVDTVEVIVRRWRAYNTALTKFLRDVLCGGAAGPGMSSVMAILGHQEVCARMGIESEPVPASKESAEILKVADA